MAAAITQKAVRACSPTQAVAVTRLMLLSCEEDDEDLDCFAAGTGLAVGALLLVLFLSPRSPPSSSAVPSRLSRGAAAGWTAAPTSPIGPAPARDAATATRISKAATRGNIC